MEPWMAHLIEEHSQLSDRLDKLNRVLAIGNEPGPADRKERLAAEQTELSDRLVRLNRVLTSVNLPDKQAALLIAQAFVMTDYLAILEKRIALA